MEGKEHWVYQSIPKSAKLQVSDMVTIAVFGSKCFYQTIFCLILQGGSTLNKTVENTIQNMGKIDVFSPHNDLIECFLSFQCESLRVYVSVCICFCKYGIYLLWEVFLSF